MCFRAFRNYDDEFNKTPFHPTLMWAGITPELLATYRYAFLKPKRCSLLPSNLRDPLLRPVSQDMHRVPCLRYRFDACTPRLRLIDAHLARQMSSTPARCPLPPAIPAHAQRPCTVRASCTVHCQPTMAARPHHVHHLSASHAPAAGWEQLPPPAVASVVGQGEHRHHRPAAAAAPSDQRPHSKNDGPPAPRPRPPAAPAASGGPAHSVRHVRRVWVGVRVVGTTSAAKRNEGSSTRPSLVSVELLNKFTYGKKRVCPG